VNGVQFRFRGIATVMLVVAACGGGSPGSPTAMATDPQPAATVSAIATATPRPTRTPQVTPAPTPRLLPTTEVPEGWRVARTGAIGVGLVAGDVLMASNYDISVVYRYDVATLESLGNLRVGPLRVFPPDAQSLAPGKGGVWVTLASQNAVALLDPPTGEMTRRITVDAAPYDLVEHDGELWIIDFEANRLTRLNRRTEEVVATIPVRAPTDVIAAEGSIWTTVHVGRSERRQPIEGNGGQIARIDPATNTVSALIDVGPRPYFLAAGFGAVWTGNATGGSVSRIDAATNAVTTIPIGDDGAFDIEVVGDSVWVIVAPQYWSPDCDPDTSFFVRIDPTTNAVRERVAFPCPDSLAVDGDRLWVSGLGADGPVAALFESVD
jgi:DNA-binding beta-propeller fold protein YncE